MERELFRDAFERMLLIRRFEEAVIRVADDFPGHRHVSVGQEAVAAAVGLSWRDGDPVFSTHRNHGHNLALGAEPCRLLAELYGRATGYCRGKGGSFHAAAADRGLLAASGIVAGNVPLAVGAGWGLRASGREGVSYCLFGDGATNEGGFHEAVNLAALWRLPVVLVCENNSEGDLRRSIGLAAPDFGRLAAAYDLSWEHVDGQDFIGLFAAVGRAADRARGGGGPTLIEAWEQRWPGSGGAWPHMPAGETDLFMAPEAPAEMVVWDRVDPLRRVAGHLLTRGWASMEELRRADERVRATIEDAVAFARQSPWPDPAELATDVFTPAPWEA